MFSAYKEGGLPIESEKRGTSMLYVAKKFQFPSGKIIRKKINKNLNVKPTEIYELEKTFKYF